MSLKSKQCFRKFATCPIMYMQVTPSSKVVGDLAQFMVQNDLDEAKLVEKASNLNLPDRSTTVHLPPLHCCCSWCMTYMMLAMLFASVSASDLWLSHLHATSLTLVVTVHMHASPYDLQPGYRTSKECCCAVWLSSCKGTWGSQQEVSLSPSPAESSKTSPEYRYPSNTHFMLDLVYECKQDILCESPDVILSVAHHSSMTMQCVP